MRVQVYTSLYKVLKKIYKVMDNSTISYSAISDIWIDSYKDIDVIVGIISANYINSFRMRMKLKKLEYHDDVKKLLME